jgi:hypothetical protein
MAASYNRATQKNPANTWPAGLEGKAGSGLLAQQELVNTTFFTVFHKLITGGAAKSLEISDGTGVGCQDFKGSACRNVVQSFFRPKNRERTIQSFCV